MTNAEVGSQQPAIRRCDSGRILDIVRCHWPEYLMEAAGLALYMLSVCIFATLLQHPASPIRHTLTSAFVRRALMGFAVGTTLFAIIMTPWGKQSGGHFNPAITLTFYRLGKVKSWDALFYVVAQFVGATGGVAVAMHALRGMLQHEAVRFAVTMPGIFGDVGAFVAELIISLSLMSVILLASNHVSLARFTPLFVGVLYATYITFETPLSGMSMNPARTFGSAFHAGYWHALWIYFVAPMLGMLTGGELFLRKRGSNAIYCAKLYHANNKRCIFCHSSGTESFRNRSG